MKTPLEVKYSFVENAEIVNRDAEEVQKFRKIFKNEVVPEIDEIEKRKTKAVEHAYRIRVCGKFWLKV